jgi:hypothetical protein
VQFIPYIELENEKVSPGINQLTSVLYPPVHSENIERQVRNKEVQEVISYMSSFPDYNFFDPVGLYMEMCFLNHWSLQGYSYYHHLGVCLVFQIMFSFCCHTSLTFCGSFVAKRIIILPRNLGGYGGSLLSPSIL